MKRGLVLLVVIIILLPVVLSAAAVFDGRLYDDEPKDVDGTQLRVASSTGRASVTYGPHKLVSYVNRCTDNSYYELCVRKTEPDLFSEFSLIPKGLDISFEKKKDPDSSEYAVSDPVLIKLEVKNDGELPLDFSITDDIADMEITNIDNICYKDNDKIVFNYSIRGKDIVTCSYRAKFLNPGKLSKKAVMTFFDGIKYQTAEKSLSFRVKEQGLKIDVITDKLIYEIGDSAKVTVKFSNLYKEPSKLENVELTPTGMNLISQPPKFSSSGRYFVLKETDIEKESALEYNFEFNVTEVNNKILIKSRALTPAGYEDKIIDKKIEVNPIKPDITLQRISDTKLKVHIQNSNSKKAIYNFKVDLKSNYQNLELSRTFSYIAPGNKVIMDVILKPFDSRPSTTYPMFASGNYETEFGESFSFSKTLPIDLRYEINQQIVEEPETSQETQENKPEVNITSKFSFGSVFSKIFSFAFKNNSTESENIEKQEVNKTSKFSSLKDKITSFKPNKKQIIIGVSVVAIVLIAFLVFRMVKKHKKIQHSEVKLQDVKL